MIKEKVYFSFLLFCRTRFTWNDTTIREVVYNDWEVFGDTVSHMVYLLVTPAVVVSVTKTL